MATELTPKEKLFADEYLIDKNATRAHKAAYCSKSDNTAAVEGHKLLRKPKIKAYISNKLEKVSKKAEITLERVLQEYGRIAFSDIRKIYDENSALKPIADLDDDSAAALAGIEVTEETDWKDGNKIVTGLTKKIRIHNKISALDSICKVMGWNAPEKKDITSNGKDIGQIDYSKLPDDVLKAIVLAAINEND
jgi:phage terminase small subunit